MKLEDKILGCSVSIEVSLRTVKSYIGGRDGILFLDPIDRENNGKNLEYSEIYLIGKGEPADKFGRRLKKGDKILLVRSEGKVKAVYGPVTEEDMYIARD